MTIILITDLLEFPNGTAGTNRIKLIAKTIIKLGFKFKIYTNTLINNDLNKDISGIVEGVEFNYIHNVINLKKNKFIKLLIYIRGVIKLIFLLNKIDKNKNYIYLYSHGSLFNILLTAICKLLNLKIIQEINEWDFKSNEKSFRQFAYNYIIKNSNGAIAISHEIIKRIKRINKNIEIIHLPIIEDKLQFINIPIVEEERYCFWMGQVDGYINDIHLIIKTAGILYNKGVIFSVYISGNYNLESYNAIIKTANLSNYPIEKIKLLGFIDNKTLLGYCKNSTFYVLPLWNDEKSINRFPTKISTFMFCGKPLFSSKIGEVGSFFNDFENIIFFKYGDYNDLSIKIQLLLNDKKIYDKLCINSYEFALNNFDYRIYEKKLLTFLINIKEK